MAARRNFPGTPSLAYALPGLFAKARSDFLALADLTWSDRTSGCAALGRVFLEDVVNLFYGHWLKISMEHGRLMSAEIDEKETEAARTRIAEKLESLRRGDHLK